MIFTFVLFLLLVPCLHQGFCVYINIAVINILSSSGFSVTSCCFIFKITFSFSFSKNSCFVSYLFVIYNPIIPHLLQEKSRLHKSYSEQGKAELPWKPPSAQGNICRTGLSFQASELGMLTQNFCFIHPATILMNDCYIWEKLGNFLLNAQEQTKSCLESAWNKLSFLSSGQLLACFSVIERQVKKGKIEC